MFGWMEENRKEWKILKFESEKKWKEEKILIFVFAKQLFLPSSLQTSKWKILH